MGYELFVVYFNPFSVTCYCSSEVFSSIRNYSFFKNFKKKKFSPPAKQRANICSNLIIKILDRHLWTLFFLTGFLPALLILLPRSYFNIFLQVSWNSSTIFWKNTQIRLELLVRVITTLFYFFKRIYMQGWKYPAKTIMCWFTGKFVLSCILFNFW